MFVALWEYEVKPGCEESFQSAYGPQGGWVRLFQRDPNYRETRLLQDLSRPRFYFTLDYWDSQAAFDHFKAANEAAYAPSIAPPNTSPSPNAASPLSITKTVKTRDDLSS